MMEVAVEMDVMLPVVVVVAAAVVEVVPGEGLVHKDMVQAARIQTSAAADARMSGTAYGTVILHVSPEAQAGGPDALLLPKFMASVLDAESPDRARAAPERCSKVPISRICSG